MQSSLEKEISFFLPRNYLRLVTVTKKLQHKQEDYEPSIPFINVALKSTRNAPFLVMRLYFLKFLRIKSINVEPWERDGEAEPSSLRAVFCLPLFSEFAWERMSRKPRGSGDYRVAGGKSRVNRGSSPPTTAVKVSGHRPPSCPHWWHGQRWRNLYKLGIPSNTEETSWDDQSRAGVSQLNRDCDKLLWPLKPLIKHWYSINSNIPANYWIIVVTDHAWPYRISHND